MLFWKRVLHEVLTRSWVFTWQTHKRSVDNKTLPATGAERLFGQTWEQSVGIICFVLLTEWPCRERDSVWCANIVSEPHLPPGPHKWVNKPKISEQEKHFGEPSLYSCARAYVSGPELGNISDRWDVCVLSCRGRRRRRPHSCSFYCKHRAAPAAGFLRCSIKAVLHIRSRTDADIPQVVSGAIRLTRLPSMPVC